MKCRAGLRLGGGLVALLCLFIITTLLGAGSAWAAPANTISESDLQALLQAGPVDGYFETVLGGSTATSQDPVRIPVTVQSIVPDYGYAGDLIVFQARGSDIEAVGGTAAGMSGSPLYVDDGTGTPKLAAAVSYTDYFTTNYLGLATPIDDMMAIENTYFATLGVTTRLNLARPVLTSNGPIGKIVIARSRAAAAALRPAPGTTVMVPLNTVQIGGLNPNSGAYKKLAAKLAAHGFDVVPAAGGMYRGSVALPALSGGSSLAAMYSMGDFWAGGLGTATYVDPANDVVVAFGHPFDYSGATDLDMATAWVQGIWTNSQLPYKLWSPAATIGSITQDRGAGVAGVLGAAPAQVPVTSQATLGGLTRTSSTTCSQWVVDNPRLPGLPSAAAAMAMQKVADAAALPGSATATVKIKVTDGTNEYEVNRTDLWSDPYDVMSVATTDIDDALSALTTGVPGVSVQVESVDFSTTLSTADRSASIEDVTTPGGLRTGTNHLTVTMLTSAGATVQVPALLTIPRGMSTSGTLEVSSANGGGPSSGPQRSMAPKAARTRQLADSAPTLAGVIDDINQWPHNTDLDIVYTPSNAGAVILPIEVLADTKDWYVEGYIKKDTGEMDVAIPSPLAYGEPLFVFGMIADADGNTAVRVYERPVGQSANKLVATLPAKLANDSTASFEGVLGGLTRNTRVTITWHGDLDHLPVTVKRMVAVRARVILSASTSHSGGRSMVHFVVRMTPAQTDGVVVIDRLVGKRWVHTRMLPARAVVRGQWRSLPGTYRLRAVLQGSSINASTASNVVKVNVR